MPSPQPTCATCGSEIVVGAPRGLCPRCMFGLDTEPSGGGLPGEAIKGTGSPATSPREGGDPGIENQMIGHYKVLHKLGEGGFGVVYMAEQRHPVRRNVALKIIKMGMDTREVVARFEAERQALAMMEHPGIAKVFDAGATETGRPYFVMELVRGIPITQYCDDHRLSTRERLELFSEVCHAVQHAHQKGIIHRDLKPSNVMISVDRDQPIPKVIDFGIAKATHQALTDRTLVTRLEQFVGTPMYMSPEQAQMSGLDIDTRSDIYSLGVLLYELLTGQLPFGRDVLMECGVEAFRRIIREDEPLRPSTRVGTLGAGQLVELARFHRSEPRQLSSSIRGDLDWIVMKAMEKDRTRRYESASSLAADIQRHLHNEPVSAAAPSVTYTLAKFARRHRKVLLAAVAVGVTLVAGTVVSTSMAIIATRARQDLKESNENLQAANTLAAERLVASYRSQGDMWLSRARLLLDQKRFLSARIAAARALGFDGFGRAEAGEAFVERYPILLDPEGTAWAEARRIVRGEFDFPMLWSRRGDEGLDTVGHVEMVRNVAFSPDGTMIASAGFDRTVRLWDAVSGEQIGVPLMGHEGVVWKVAFSPDGSLLASSGDGGELFLWDLKTRGHRRLKGIPGAIFTLAFDPDGTRLATGGYDREILLWDVATGEPIGQPLQAHDSLVYDLSFDPTGKRLASVGRDNTLRLWNVAQGGDVFAEINHRVLPDVLRAVAFHPDGAMVATAGDAGAVEFWSLPDLANVRTLDDRAPGIGSLSFSPDGDLLAASGKDKQIRIWQVATSSLRATLEGHQTEIQSIAFGPDGTVLASCGKDTTVRLWNVERAAGIPVRASGPIRYARDGKILAASTGDGRIGIYDSVTGEPLDEFRHASAVTGFDVSPDGALLAVGCENHAIYLWDLRTSILVGSPMTGHFGEVNCLRFTPDGSALASGGSDGSTMLWNIGDQSLRWREENSMAVLCMDISPSGDLLVAAGNDSRIHLWRLGSGDPIPLAVLGNDERAEIEVIAFDPAGKRLASAGKIDDSHLVRIWSVDASSPLAVHDHGDRVHSLCFAAGGEILAIGDENHQIHLWDIAREVDVSVLRGHSGPVTSLALDASRQRLTSASGDGTVRTWQLDPACWNSTAHLMTALHPQLSWIPTVPDGADNPYFNWTNLAMGETAPPGEEHYLALLRKDHPPDREGLFWRFYQAKNWGAARFELDQLPAKVGQARRLILAETLALEALRFLAQGDAAMTERLLEEATAVAADSPRVLAAQAKQARSRGDLTAALALLDRATAAVAELGDSVAAKRVRFDVDRQHFEFLLADGRDAEVPLVLDRMLANDEGAPAGLTARDLLSPLIDLPIERVLAGESTGAERLLRMSAAIEIAERMQRNAPLDPRSIRGLRELEKLAGDSAESSLEILPMNGEWKYLANGEAAPLDWMAPDFDDSEWPQGPALLGFGRDNNIETLLSRNEQGSDPDGDSWMAFYFRHTLNYQPPPTVPDGEDWVLVLQIKRDDGVIVYLNGERVVSDNMPEGEITHETRALEGVSTIPIEQEIHQFDLPSRLLLPGRNVFAAEVHQERVDSSDLHLGMRAVLKPMTATSYFARLASQDPGAITETLEDVKRLLPPSLAAQWLAPLEQALRAGLRE